MWLYRLTWLCQLAVLGASGCGASSEPSELLPGLVLGTGESEFEQWGATPTLPLSAGVQGGFHIWVSFLTTGFTPFGRNGNLLNIALVTRVEGVENSELTFLASLGFRPYETSLPQDPRPVLTFPGYPAQIFDARCSHGREVHVELTVSDSSGHTASDERSGILEIDEANRGQGCN